MACVAWRAVLVLAHTDVYSVLVLLLIVVGKGDGDGGGGACVILVLGSEWTNDDFFETSNHKKVQ